MKINIHSHKVNLSDSEKDYIEKKLEYLSHLGGKMQDESVHCEVNVSYDNTKISSNKIAMKVVLTVPKHLMHAELSAPTVNSAIDLIEDKLAAQVKKYISKMQG